MKQRLYLFLMLVVATLTASARDFKYEGITYTVLDEEAKTVETKQGQLSGRIPGNEVAGSLSLPANPKDGEEEYILIKIGDLSFCETALTDVVLPETIDTIGCNAFYACWDLRSIELPQHLTTIDYRAFQYCRNLTSIHLPESLTLLGNCAFEGSGLTSITLPNSLTSIGNAVFMETYLTTVMFSNSITSIGSLAFYGCTKLTSIILPESLTSIEECAFEGCTALTSIKFPETLISIEKNAFSRCTNLTSIELPESLTSIEEKTFYQCSALNSVKFPTSLTSIGESAFSECVSLTAIDLPDTLITIGESAFEGCTALTAIDIPSTLTTIEGMAFSGCTALTSITLPEALTSIGWRTFYGCTSLTSINFPEKLTSICSQAFTGCIGLKSIEFPEALTSIEDNAFASCTSLTSIDLPNSLTTLGMGAFYNCTGLTSIKLPESLISIEYGAFAGCSGLTNLTIPAGVREIDDAFYGCENITSLNYEAESCVWYGGYYPYKLPPSITKLTIGKNVEYITSGLFSDVKGLESITFESRERRLIIGKDAFYNCPNIARVTIPTFEEWLKIDFNSPSSNPMYYTHKFPFEYDNMRRIQIPEGTTRLGSYAFYGLEEALAVTLPTSLKEAGTGVFSDCSNLQQIIFPDFKTYLEMSYDKSDVNLTYENNAELYIGSENLSAYTDKTEIILPDDLTRIAPYAFYKNSYMESIDIPQTVISIGDYAFGSCHKLKSIELPNSVTELGEGVFQNSAIDYINVPSELETIGKDAFYYVSLKSFDIPDIEKWCGIAFANAYANPISAIGSFSVNGKEISNIRIGNEQTNIEPYSFCRANNIIRLRVDAHKIGEQAFSNCSNVSALCLHTDSIASKAFANMDSLTEIYCLTDTPPEAADDLFSKYNGITLHVPIGAKAAYENSQPCWWKFLNIVESDFKDIDMLFPSDIDSIETGVDDISSIGNEEREIFTLDGIKITGNKDNLAPGVYIMIENNRRHKIRIK